MKRKNVIRIVFGCITLSFAALACTAFSFAWFFTAHSAENQAIDGIVGLREYFYNVYEEGEELRDGRDADHAFEIVTPTHFYNLTRLQNLGVFSEKKYFKIGHNFGTAQDPIIKVLDDEGNRVDFLDMTSYFSENDPFSPIGNEAAPFYGVFDGQSVPVKGLKITGNSQDIGVFGYIAHSSSISNFICTNIEVASDGYPKKVGNNPVDPLENQVNYLYAEEIDEIFDQLTGFQSAKVSFTPANGQPINCKVKTSVSSPDGDNLYSPSSPYRLGQFSLTPPTLSVEDYQFEYSLVSSTGVINVEKDSNGNSYLASIDLNKLPSLMTDGTSQVAINESAILNTSLSVVASVKIRGITYSRVIQSYAVEFKRLADLTKPRAEQTSELLLKISCKYYKTEQGDYLSSDHGYNIGFIVGHADGSVSKCYVYNGLLKMNSNNTYNIPVANNSETGLIGKLGDNITSNISPFVDTSTGDTGVLNFSYIYSQIRQPFSQRIDDETHDPIVDTVLAGYVPIYTGQTAVNSDYRPFVAYAVERDTATVGGWNVDKVSTFDNYSKYLRAIPASEQGQQNPTSKYYITYAASESGVPESTIYRAGYNNYKDVPAAYNVPTAGSFEPVMNSVDFAWDKVIEDEQLTTRGLGVFKVVTSHDEYPLISDSRKYVNDIGKFSIHYLDDEHAKKAIYFSTAECDWTKTLRDGKNKPIDGWNDSTKTPVRMNTLPTYSTTDSFKWPFSRDFNYLFKLDFSESSKFIDAYDGMRNYMYNTDSVFLQNYLQSILVNKSGQPITPNTKAFGFKVQFSQDKPYDSVTKLNSYLKVGIPGNTKQYTATYRNDDGTWQDPKTVYLPPRSIVFEIKSDVANVSIAGNGTSNISIYSYDPTVENYEPVELYTMYSRNNGGTDSGRYFAYSIGEKYNGEYTKGVYTEENKTELDEHGNLIDESVLLNTKTVVTPENGNLTDADYLYGHIFKLKKGHYVIGASRYLQNNKDDTADVYYVSVQGQTLGDLGELDVIKVGNTITDTDFLLKDPVGMSLDDSFYAELSFGGNFTTGTEAIVIDAGVTPHIQARLNDCVTYLVFSCRKTENPYYTVNGEVITTNQPVDEDFTYGNSYSYSANMTYWENLLTPPAEEEQEEGE